MGGADIEKPLLEHNQLNPVFPNCPGCKNAYLQSPDAGVPYKQFITVFLLVLCSSLPISSLYPFLYFMVQDFHITKSDKDLGFYVGAIGAAFMVGRAMTAVLWGIAADKYGRKPVMLIGVISVIVFHTLFGFSQNFWMAVLTRFLLGLFNGLHGPAKAYVSEVSNANHQALGVSIIGTSWGLGLILGPALGGYLSQPALKYPDIFTEGSLFARFPYLLPSLCNTVFAIGVLFISFQLPETLHKHGIDEQKEYATEQPSQVWPTYHKSIAGSSGSLLSDGIDSPPLFSPIGSFREYSRSNSRSNGRSSIDVQGVRGIIVGRSKSGRSSVEEEDGDISSTINTNNMHPNQLSKFNDSLIDRGNKMLWRQNSNIAPPPSIEQSQQIPPPNVSTTDPEMTDKLSPLPNDLIEAQQDQKKPLLSRKPFIGGLVLYCIWSLHDMAYVEVFSLWCVSPKSNGGLGFTTADVGEILGLSGFVVLIFQLLIFPYLSNFLGPIMVFSVPMVVAYPAIATLSGMALWVIVAIVSCLKNVFTTMIFTASMILLNNSVPQDQRGAANGLSVSLASVFKAIGPAGGGALFAWGQKRPDTSILPGNYLVFAVLGFIGFLSCITTFEPFLPRSTNDPFSEEADE
ncbi:hypothetical protein BDL97_09G018300 [Sphagnum fallax]|nr:hypothetical protein BDL97_09G018300 [Sphagnum fallax]KAH8951272.1 hypothetical protein BDL97_09G018300 [Sphagnum fallax]